ncbi:MULTISPECIES: IclR family transcriptional regulator [unclassified Mesorhizobium]|uniref:IclR family transcriptional regulator n=1 Tax=unclassified Mesorhizobium TaxID=325217 RepID=UPI001CD1532C|nr:MULTISPECIES: IclR family transcriptional regulator [unclassified Mesorhizobium]MBZ9973878.1 IclR family transcriptional regulator [Mesorhizobium sp. BR-1-1-10]
MAKDEGAARQSAGIQSLDAALRVLNTVVAFREPVTLSELARTCRMPVSKVHRYLSSFMKVGLVAQTGRSGKYLLGPGALQLGLAAIGRHDFVNFAADGVAELCAETGMTALLSVWGNGGATVVRWERAESPTVTSMGLGTTLPLLNSATGRAFLAWAPPAAIKASCDAELRRIKKNPSIAPDLEPTVNGIEKLNRLTRERGYAFVEGKFIPGLVAIAAPILDWQHEAQAVITLIGTDTEAIKPGSSEVISLVAFCAEKSVVPPSI